MSDPFRDLPMRLTYRTAQVLSSIAAVPGASSKQIAGAAGISDEGQTSRLMGRLERLGLVRNTGGLSGRGEAKAWTLTERGRGIVGAIVDGDQLTATSV
jgi:DNA-binding MarR family transcriptional regulator